MVTRMTGYPMVMMVKTRQEKNGLHSLTQRLRIRLPDDVVLLPDCKCGNHGCNGTADKADDEGVSSAQFVLAVVCLVGDPGSGNNMTMPRIAAIIRAAFRKNRGRVVLALVGIKKVRR